jgi:4-aminobutyrate aminotransferase-like enzyme
MESSPITGGLAGSVASPRLSVDAPSPSPVRVLSTGLSGAGGALRAVRGNGSKLTLEDGRRVIDASNTSAPLGHAHPEVVEAIKRAANSPVLNEGWDWHGRDEAAAQLVASAFQDDVGWVGGVRFCSSGSEANDLALSLAQALTGRKPLVARERSYHGGSGLARDVTLQPHWHGGLSAENGDVRLVPKTTVVRELPMPECAGGPGESCEQVGHCTCVGDVDQQLAGAAAVIIDYSQGGVYASPLYQDAIADAARRAGALWIADEVVTALGRTGQWLNYTRGESRPDIVTLGKPLAGGAAPAAAIVVSEEIRRALEGYSWQNYGTFRGHPLAVAAIPATLKAIEREQLVVRAAELDRDLLRPALTQLERHASVERVGGLGLHWTVELKGGDWRTWTAGPGERPPAARVFEEALSNRVLIATSGEESSVFLAPPLNVSISDLEEIIETIDLALTAADEWLP